MNHASRLGVIAIAVAAGVVLGCSRFGKEPRAGGRSAKPAALPGVWPMAGGEAGRTRRTRQIGPATRSLLWRLQPDDPSANLRCEWPCPAGPSSPAIGHDDTIYVGSERSGYVYALTPEGTVKWRARTWGMVLSSPALGVNGLVYVGSCDGRLYALDAQSGATVCSADLDGPVYSSPAVGDDGTVYVGSDSKNLYALDAETCAIRWTFRTESMIRSSPALGPDGAVYVSDDKNVYAVSPRGRERWRHAAHSEDDATPVVASIPRAGAAALTVFVSDDDKLYALDAARGATVWAVTLGRHTQPAVGWSGTLFVGSEGGLNALKPDGSFLWNGGAVQYGGAYSPVVDGGNTAYAGTARAKGPAEISAHDGATGNGRWSLSSWRHGFGSAMAIGHDRTLVLVTGGGIVYKFGGTADTPGLIDSTSSASSRLDPPIRIGSSSPDAAVCPSP